MKVHLSLRMFARSSNQSSSSGTILNEATNISQRFDIKNIRKKNQQIAVEKMPKHLKEHKCIHTHSNKRISPWLRGLTLYQSSRYEQKYNSVCLLTVSSPIAKNFETVTRQYVYSQVLELHAGASELCSKPSLFFMQLKETSRFGQVASHSLWVSQTVLLEKAKLRIFILKIIDQVWTEPSFKVW